MHARHGKRFLNARLLIAALALTLLTTAGALAAPPDDRVLPVDQYSSPKGRALGEKYATALQALNKDIYHCLPWVHVEREGIGFFRPKHLGPEIRYLSLEITVEQEPSREFAQQSAEQRASAMFSRYVGPMVRRMTRAAALVTDPMVDGFTVIVHWLKPTIEAGTQPVNETIAAFVERSVVADYLAGRARASDLAIRATVLGFDGKTAVGRLTTIQGWEDNFLTTFQIANYRLEPGVTCR